MSVILAGTVLREEVKKIAAAKKYKKDIAENRWTDEQRKHLCEKKEREKNEQEWEKKYLDWVLIGKPKREGSPEKDKHYLLTERDFVDCDEFVNEFRKKNRTAEAERLWTQFSPALRYRLDIKSFDKWLGTTLLAEINQALKEKEFSWIDPTLKSVEDPPETRNVEEQKLAHNRRLLKTIFDVEINTPHKMDKQDFELNEKSVKMKKFLRRLRDASQEERKNPTSNGPRVRVYRMLSSPIRYALLNNDFEKSEIQMLTEELNRLLQGAPLFTDFARKAEQVVKPGISSGQKDICEPGEVAKNAQVEKHYLEESALSCLAKNRLHLQMAFPTHVAKVWDSLPVVYAWIHAHDDPRNALCLSGGGIRSATFGLGVLQGLAEANVLDCFEYMSTVSGGGYIGAWLSAWWKRSCDIETAQGRLSKPISELLKREPKKSLEQQASDPFEPEPPELRHLREYSNYLTPKLGLTSADTWTLIGTYLRNLALNWVVFLPAILALLALPRIWVAVVQLKASLTVASVLLVIGMLSAISAIVYAARNRPSLGDPCNAVRGTVKFWLFCLAPLCASAFCLTAFWAWLQNGELGFERVFADLESMPFPGLRFALHILEWGAHLGLFLGLGLALHVVAWGAYIGNLKKYPVKEFIVCALTGLVSGFFLWLGAKAWQQDFGSAPGLEWFVCFGVPYFLLSFVLGVFLFVGMASRFTDDPDREWWARMGAWILLAGVIWGVFSTLVLFGPEWLLKLPKVLSAVGGITGIITIVLSHSGASPANKKEAVTLGKKGIPVGLVLGIAAPVFVAVFIIALSLGTTWLVANLPVRPPECDGATLFSQQDVIDVPSLALRLKEHEEKDRASGYLWSGLTAGLKSQLTDYDSSDAQTKALRASLTHELNSVIVTNHLATNAAFLAFLPGHVPDGLEKALGEDVGGQKLMQRNRYLLERAYPRELALGRFDHEMITHQCHWLKIVLIMVGFMATAVVLSHTIDINRFSLHAVYRNRLIRAYLGASNANRRPNAFTGFDPTDNVHMGELSYPPFHVVNMALNLVNGENLAWQQRKAESFTASPLHAGSHRLGFRKVTEYGLLATDPAEKGRQQADNENGLTLGTVVTISGAAASPNMGYHSSPALAVLMTLFNIRLGAWLGNPGKAGDKSYKDGCPRSAFLHLILEALGWTNDKSKYVYLSDGGHFENLGLYEMVLRRCRRIVVSDAGCDPKCALEDLGNAIRKIRIDLGIPIRILEQFRIYSRNPSSSSKYCARGIIDYGAVDGKQVQPGELLYIKPAIGGNEPKDVFNYKESSLLFPHEPTSDQWFSESQFESYRMLGKHILDEIWGGNQNAKEEKEEDGRTPTPTAKDLQKLKESDPLGYLLKAAARYLEKPLVDVPDVSRARRDVMLVGKAHIGI